MSLDNRGSLEPWIKDEVKFYEHQVEGVKHLKNIKSFLLADDMGLGKSLQTLAVFGMMLWTYKKKYDRSGRMLVVVPTNLKDNWEAEILKYTGFNYVKLESVVPKKREAQLQAFEEMEDPKILIVHYEQVKPHLAKLNSFNFDVVAADEAHALKSPTSVRAKAFGQLRAGRKFFLTGSPLLNHVHELWFMLDQISPGQWGTYWQFCQRYCVYGGFKNKKIVGTKNIKELTRKLNTIMLRRLKEDVLDLPDVVYTERKVHLTPLQKEIYNKIVDEQTLDRHDGKGDTKIEYDFVIFLRLQQLCGTTATILEDGSEESGKLDAAMDDAIQIIQAGNKLIVFSKFRAVLDAYHARLAAEFSNKDKYPNGVPVFQVTGDLPQKLRQPMVDMWTQHEGPAVVLGIIKVIGVGLNMTAARYGQFLDKEFTPMLNKQAVDRMNRIGASLVHSVNILEYRYVGVKADLRVNNILKEKKFTNDLIVENDDEDFQAKVSAAIKEKV